MPGPPQWLSDQPVHGRDGGGSFSPDPDLRLARGAAPGADRRTRHHRGRGCPGSDRMAPLAGSVCGAGSQFHGSTRLRMATLSSMNSRGVFSVAARVLM